MGAGHAGALLLGLSLSLQRPPLIAKADAQHGRAGGAWSTLGLRLQHCHDFLRGGDIFRYCLNDYHLHTAWPVSGGWLKAGNSIAELAELQPHEALWVAESGETSMVPVAAVQSAEELQPRQLTHAKDHGPHQSPPLHRRLLPHGHRPRLSPLRPHLHRPPRRRPRRHGGSSPLCRNAARRPDDDALRHRHRASADSGGEGGE